MPDKFLSPIIKSDDVNIEGTYQLPLTPGAKPQSTPNSNNFSDQASARVVETSDTYALIEITCPCGTVSQIQCSYN